MTWQLYASIAGVLLALAYWQRRALLFGLMETRFWAWVLKNIIRKLRVPWEAPRMTAAKYRAVWAAARPGAILLGTKAGWLANKLTPGLTSHGALFLGYNRVAETTGEGDTTIDLMDFCFHYSRIIVGECTDWDAAYINGTILPESAKLEGTEYDHAFKPGKKRVYCFERIELVDTEGRLKIQHELLFGKRKLVTGDSIMNADNFEVVCDTDNLPSLSQGA